MKSSRFKRIVFKGVWPDDLEGFLKEGIKKDKIRRGYYKDKTWLEFYVSDTPELAAKYGTTILKITVPSSYVSNTVEGPMILRDVPSKYISIYARAKPDYEKVRLDTINKSIEDSRRYNKAWKVYNDYWEEDSYVGQDAVGPMFKRYDVIDMS